MKVALCLSGHMRSYDHCFPYLKQNIIDVLKADVYICTYDTLGYWKQLTNNEINNREVNNLEPGIDNSTTLDIATIQDLYKPITMEMYSFKEREHYFIQQSNILKQYTSIDTWYYRIKNFLSMYFMANKCLELIKDNKYDLIIRTRPDILFEQSLSFINTFDNNYLYVCNNYAETNTLGDIFFAGSLELIKKYHSLYYNIDEILNKEKLFNPHKLIKSWIDYNQIPYKVISLNAILYNSVNGYCNQGRVKL